MNPINFPAKSQVSSQKAKPIEKPTSSTTSGTTTVTSTPTSTTSTTSTTNSYSKFNQIDAQTSFECVESPIIRACVTLEQDEVGKVDTLHSPLSVGPIHRPTTTTTSSTTTPTTSTTTATGTHNAPIYVNKLELGSLTASDTCVTSQQHDLEKPRPHAIPTVGFNSLQPAESTQSLKESNAPLSPKYIGSVAPPLMMPLRSKSLSFNNFILFITN